MRILLLLALAFVAQVALAQDPQVAANAPKDKPWTLAPGTSARFEADIAPKIAEARKTYPAAKAKYLAGLPTGQSFFVTTRLHDGSPAYEQAFIAVTSIKDGIVTGRIWSEINHVRSYRLGDWYSFPESDVIDWLITHPDGSEEGNVVGKFLDTYDGT
jgi:hypothetical protein